MKPTVLFSFHRIVLVTLHVFWFQISVYNFCSIPWVTFYEPKFRKHGCGSWEVTKKDSKFMLIFSIGQRAAIVCTICELADELHFANLIVFVLNILWFDFY